jgi:hypothetical protein
MLYRHTGDWEKANLEQITSLLQIIAISLVYAVVKH